MHVPDGKLPRGVVKDFGNPTDCCRDHKQGGVPQEAQHAYHAYHGGTGYLLTPHAQHAIE
jgi:hypothetical protein